MPPSPSVPPLLMPALAILFTISQVNSDMMMQSCWQYMHLLRWEVELQGLPPEVVQYRGGRQEKWLCAYVNEFHAQFRFNSWMFSFIPLM